MRRPPPTSRSTLATLTALATLAAATAYLLLLVATLAIAGGPAC